MVAKPGGVYGEMWAAALVAAAFATDSAADACRAALPVVPPGSPLAEVLRGVLDLRLRRVDGARALDWVDETLGQYGWVHVLSNAAVISVALRWGEDFMDAAAISVSAGRDTDSTTATVGSVYDALHGEDAVPAVLIGTTHVHGRSAVRDFDRITLAELADRTLRAGSLTLRPIVAS